MFNGKINYYFGPFSTAMLNYQRVYLGLVDIHSKTPGYLVLTAFFCLELEPFRWA
jgi:hypothetical protein